ncbi:MAG: hypothetical protein ABIO43_04905 [Sphingomicrobium sp.]
MSDLRLRMTEAKRRLIERKMIPRAFYLRHGDFEAFGGTELDHVPVRRSRADNPSALYSTRGCKVSVPVRL